MPKKKPVSSKDRRLPLVTFFVFVVGTMLLAYVISAWYEKEQQTRELTYEENQLIQKVIDSSVVQDQTPSKTPKESVFMPIPSTGNKTMNLKEVIFDPNDLGKIHDSLKRMPEIVVDASKNTHNTVVKCSKLFERRGSGYVEDYRYIDGQGNTAVPAVMSDEVIRFVNETNKELFKGKHGGNVPEIEELFYCEVSHAKSPSQNVQFYLYNVPVFLGGGGSTTYIKLKNNDATPVEVSENCRDILFVDDDNNLFAKCFDFLGESVGVIDKISLNPEKLGVKETYLSCPIVPGENIDCSRQ